MKFAVLLVMGGSIELEEVDDYAYESEDSTFNFVHTDESLSTIPRERVLMIKELREEEPTKH